MKQQLTKVEVEELNDHITQLNSEIRELLSEYKVKYFKDLPICIQRQIQGNVINIAEFTSILSNKISREMR